MYGGSRRSVQGTTWVSEGESECPISEFMSVVRFGGLSHIYLAAKSSPFQCCYESFSYY